MQTMKTITIPRKDFDDVPTTMYLRVRDPRKASALEQLLHEVTPLFVYTTDGDDYVRIDVPHEVAQKYGMADMQCACCAPDEQAQVQRADTSDSVHFDTAWSEVGPWFKAHGYRKAVV